MDRFAYVDFATPELQDLAVGLSESFFEGRKLLIKKGERFFFPCPMFPFQVLDHDRPEH